MLAQHGANAYYDQQPVDHIVCPSEIIEVCSFELVNTRGNQYQGNPLKEMRTS
jgi:hypothetical protein